MQTHPKATHKDALISGARFTNDLKLILALYWQFLMKNYKQTKIGYLSFVNLNPGHCTLEDFYNHVFP